MRDHLFTREPRVRELDVSDPGERVSFTRPRCNLDRRPTALLVSLLLGGRHSLRYGVAYLVESYRVLEVHVLNPAPWDESVSVSFLGRATNLRPARSGLLLGF